MDHGSGSHEDWHTSRLDFGPPLPLFSMGVGALTAASGAAMVEWKFRGGGRSVSGDGASPGPRPRPLEGSVAAALLGRSCPHAMVPSCRDGRDPASISLFGSQLGPHRPALVSCRAGVGPTRQLALGARLPYLLAGTPDGPGQAFSGWPSQFSQGPHGKAGPSEQARGHSPPCAPVRVRLAACPASLSHAQTPVGRLFGTLATSRKERTRMAVFHVKRAV